MGIVHELTEAASGSGMRVSELLRRALTVAVRLKLGADVSRFENELKGYGAPIDVPEYRQIPAMIYFNAAMSSGPLPVDVGDAELNHQLRTVFIVESIGVLESLVATTRGTVMSKAFPEGIQALLRKAVGSGQIIFSQQFTMASISGVLEHVRGDVHAWSLALEAAGIVGDGHSFSTEEQRKAQQIMTVQNLHVHGSLGSVVNEGGVSQGVVSGSSTNVVTSGSTVGSINTGVSGDGVVSQESFESDITAILHAMVDRIEDVEASAVTAMKALKQLDVSGQKLEDLTKMVEDVWVKNTNAGFETFAQRYFAPGAVLSSIATSLSATALWKALGLLAG